MPKQNLSPEQSQIIDQWLKGGEPIVVEASAGSGKTRVLTEAVRRIIEESPKERFKILCLTFTNKAAEEMQERLSDVGKIKERTFIETTHSFALDIIRARRHELGMDEMPTIIDKESDRKKIVTEVVLSNPSLSRYYQKLPENSRFDDLAKFQTDLLNKCLIFISRKKQELIWLDHESDNPSGQDWTLERINLYKDYNDLLRNQNLIDYDDIILLAWKILSERPAVANLYRRIYRYVLVDEAQDLSFAQYELIKALCGDAIKNIMMVGDPNQAIHGYAGASQRFMTQEFIKDFSLSDTQRKRIEYNYRSSNSVIDLANELAGIKQNNVDSYYPGKIEFLSFEDEEAEAEWVLEKLHEIIGQNKNDYDGDLTPSKVAILGRNRFVFNSLAAKLKDDAIFKNKFFLKKGPEILDPQSTTMKIFDLGTRILCNQRAHLYYNQLTAILNIPKEPEITTPIGIAELKSILASSRIDFLPDNVYECLLEVWRGIENDINRFPNVLQKIEKCAENIEEAREKDLLLNDIKEWEEAWGKYVRSVAANAKSISDFRRFLAMGITKSQNQSGLTLATIHTVKGLEFYVVFLIGAGEGTFPDYRAIRKENIEEERNNAYVAVTRAKRELYITYPVTKNVPWGEMKQEKSSFFQNKEFKFTK